MSDVDEIKSRLNIVDIVSERVPLKKAGRNLKALCPFHNEKTPSFIVSPERQTFHCFGCGKGGSVIDFVMEYDHVDFLEALETLAEKAGVKLEHRPTDTPQAKLKEKLYQVNHLASEFYHYLLTKHRLGETARMYLKGRGVSDKSVATFTLGYSPNSWDGLLRFLRKKGYDEQLLETAGLVLRSGEGREKSQTYYDRFRGRVMFTLKDHRGNVVGFAGRVLDPSVKEAKYINTSETPVYVKSNVLYGLDVTKAAIQKEQEAIVMEGELDVISSFQAGIGNVVAIKGSAITEGHVHLLRRFSERLIFALDSDMAGDAAARRGIEIADRAGFDMRVAAIPEGKDPDEAARSHPAALKKALKEALPIYDYFLSSVTTRFDKATAFGKKKISEELLPIIAKIENPIVQGHYVRKLADTLSVNEETVTDGLRRSQQAIRSGMAIKEKTTPDQPGTRRDQKLELYILALLLQGKTAELFEDLAETIRPVDFEEMAVRRILEALATYAGRHKIFLVKDFADRLPHELLPTFDEAFLWDISDFAEDENRFIREWNFAVRELRRLVLKRTIARLTQKLRDKEHSEKERDSLQEELKDLTHSLQALEKASQIR